MWGESVQSETIGTTDTRGERSGPVAGRRRTAGGDGAAAPDPRVTGLATAVAQMRVALDAYPVELRDRRPAEDQLDALAAMARSGTPDVPSLRQSLLLISAALGSVSALAAPLAALRGAVELFGRPVG